MVVYPQQTLCVDDELVADVDHQAHVSCVTCHNIDETMIDIRALGELQLCELLEKVVTRVTVR